MTIVTTDDGRVLNGLMVQRNESSLILQTATERITLSISEVEAIRESEQSAMPDGLLQNLSVEEVRDLIGYLQTPIPLERQ